MSRQDGADTVDEPNSFVRPVGYVDPDPVTRRIGFRDCFLGNVHAADPARYDGEPEVEFEFVLSATQDPQPATTHHHPLEDGPGNEWSQFEAAVDTARELLGSDGPALIHCKAGISRSTTLLATAIAAEEGRSFREALSMVQAARPLAVPHPALHELAVCYLAALE